MNWKVALAALLFIFALGFSLEKSHASNVSDATGVGRTQDIKPNENYKNLGITKNVVLDSFEGPIEGHELACEDDSNGSIGFCGAHCSSEAPNNQGATISRDCADFLDRYMVKCVEAVGCKKSTSFCGVGGHAKRTARNSSVIGPTRPSRHSVGDALDIGGLRCKDKDGNPFQLDFTIQGRRRNPQAYDTFVSCFSMQVAASRQPQPKNFLRTLFPGKPQPTYHHKCGGIISCRGSGRTADRDSDHDDHIHVSCPIIRKQVSCR